MFKNLPIYFLLFACLVSLSHNARADRVEGLTWAPPAQLSPNVYRVTKHKKSIRVQKNNDIPKTYALTSHIQIKLRNNEDAIVVLPNDILSIPSLRIHHGRHIRIIGGHLKAVMPANKTVRGLIWAGGTRGSIYIEGVVLDADFQNGMDALLVGGYSNQPAQTYPDVYVQNVVMQNVVSADGNIYHADCFQYYGPVNSTFMDRVDCKTDTQGFFIPPQNHIGSIDLRRVTIDYIHPKTANGYALYLRDRPDDQAVPTSLSDVYVGRRDTSFGYGFDGEWGVYSVFPHTLQKHGGKRVENKITFPHQPEIIGGISLLKDESFVLDAGAAYRPVYYGD